MGTAIANAIHAYLAGARHPGIVALNQPETRMPWPGQMANVAPIADITAQLVDGRMLVVEIDDQCDPCRSVIKYWPLLDAMASGSFEHPSLHFVEISSPNSTYGAGFQALAQFIGQRFSQLYPGLFEFTYLPLRDQSAESTADLAKAVLATLTSDMNEGVAGQRVAPSGPRSE